jgi:signal transduction histidine kinase
MYWLLLLDWALIAVSFFNTIVLIWLGLTVLLNADRRHWGTWAAGIGFLSCGAFFIGHTAIVGRVIGTFEPEMALWWPISWLLVVGAPYLWYVVMLAYTGVLEAGRHRGWLSVVTVLGIAAVALLRLSEPLPTYEAIIEREPLRIFSLFGVPVVVLVYPLYSVLCFLLALLALRTPAASGRFMGDLARRRARPWLMWASLVLLAVSLLIAAAAEWFLVGVQSRPSSLTALRMLPPLMGFDVLISALLSVAVVFTGQAIVSYEIFTGTALPRGGLLRFWRQSLNVAAGYSALIAMMLSIPPFVDFDPIYRLLLATVLMAGVLGLLTWRTYTERERDMDRLRPFLASQHIYEQLLKPTAPPDLDVGALFRALGHDVLGAKLGHLAALGPLAPLMGPSLSFANGVNAPPTPSLAALTELAAQFQSPHVICVPLDPAQYGGAVWAIPLWSERGLIGVMLLGEKRDGGLYTQEEIEIARAGGERLIDTQASAEMARRLMGLQRQRLAASQVVDRRARRVLHDDVLPRLHTAMLQLSASTTPEATEVMNTLADLHRQIANLLQSMPTTVAPEVTRLGLVGALHRAVDSDLANAFDGVQWHIASDAEQRAQSLSALQSEVLFYAACEAIRNAARYGRDGDPGRRLHLSIKLEEHQGLRLMIEDDGVGMGAAHSSSAGSGQGLGLHTTMMAVIGGTLTTESAPNRFTRVTLAVPEGA